MPAKESQMLTDRYLEGDYLDKVPTWHSEDAPWKAAHILRMLAKHGITPRSVCEVGCGSGEILAQLQSKMDRDVVFTGFDISPQAIAICRPKENAKLKFHERDFVKAPREDETYDVLLVLDVFEHVPDYFGFLEALKRRARWIVFHIPLEVSVESVLRKSKYMMFMHETYGHLHFFTKETALAALADTGYRVVDYAFTTELAFRGLAQKPVGLKAALFFPFRSLFILTGMLLFRMAPAFTARLIKGNNLLVLAEARD
jgi:ubiquinone/menaquinone biosynthesis C-methylase UbiE